MYYTFINLPDISDSLMTGNILFVTFIDDTAILTMIPTNIGVYIYSYINQIRFLSNLIVSMVSKWKILSNRKKICYDNCSKRTSDKALCRTSHKVSSKILCAPFRFPVIFHGASK